jgi:hypothetical protein
MGEMDSAWTADTTTMKKMPARATGYFIGCPGLGFLLIDLFVIPGFYINIPENQAICWGMRSGWDRRRLPGQKFPVGRWIPEKKAFQTGSIFSENDPVLLL